MQSAIYLFFQVASLIFSVFLYFKKRDKILLYFIPFLLLTVSIELFGYWSTTKDLKNYWVYNVFTTIEFLFYSLLFFLHFKKPVFKKLVSAFAPTFVALVILNILLLQGFNKTFNTYTFLLGSFFIVIFCCCFFYESVLPEKIDQQLSRQPFFWITSGLLIFYLGSVIINALFEYLRNNDLQAEGIRIYSIINNILNVLLYGSFCIAFYLCPDNKKISSSQS